MEEEELVNLEMETKGLVYLLDQRTFSFKFLRVAYPILFLQLTYLIILVPVSVTNVIPSLIYLPMTALNLKFMQIVFSCWQQVENDDDQDDEDDRDGLFGKLMNFLLLGALVAGFQIFLNF